jgi:hypothetical protein
MQAPMLTPLTVMLSYAEIRRAHLSATERMIMVDERAATSKYGAPEDEDGDQLHLQGCRGELACCKALNLHWSGAEGIQFGAIDVGGTIEVRTRSEAWHDLILRPKDREDLPYVLAIAHGLRRIDLVGWILGSDGKQPAHWDKPNGRPPAFFVKQRYLYPINTLRPGCVRRYLRDYEIRPPQ